MGVQAFYDKGPHPLFWSGSRAARGKMTASGTPNCLNCCEFFYIIGLYTLDKSGRGLHGTNLLAAGWRPVC